MTYFRDGSLDGYLLCGKSVGDANVNYLTLEVVDTLSCVALVPRDAKGLGAILDALFDEGV